MVRKAAASESVDLTCPWNDHGHICGERGSLSDSLNGSGPWYCSKHYWTLKGDPVEKNPKAVPNFRQRWFRENHAEYFPPKLEPCEPFRLIGKVSG